MREEVEVIRDLELLCQSAGYVHALAFLCYKHNIIGFGDEVSPEDLTMLTSSERVIKTEFSLLMGLMVKAKIDTAIPPSNVIQEYIDKTMVLIEELHQSFFLPFQQKDASPLETPFPMKEVIFYSGDSAYPSQYREMSLLKYGNDNEWLIKNKGVTVEEIVSLASDIHGLMNDKMSEYFPTLIATHPEKWTLLPGFSFTAKELSTYSGVGEERIILILDLFSLSDFPCNGSFSEIGDFNLISERPVLCLSKGEYILFHNYLLMEAIYENPFYWFAKDKSYKISAQDNRGAFVENFCAGRLARVFGEQRIYKNVVIKSKKGEHLGEIDTLVIYADRAIILQAKSKRLTLPARKGNDNLIRDDFKKAISDSYGQGWDCANFLLNKEVRLFDKQGQELELRREYEAIYIFCVVSDHYPGLAFQAREFLKVNEHDIIKSPFVMDVFLLDVMTEFLDTPLYFLDYVNKRALYYHKVMAAHEITILSYHLKRNLWLEEADFYSLGDDISQDLDAAMLVRREGLPGKDTPEGLLTVFKGKVFGDLIAHINSQEHDGIIDLGFLLLNMSQDTAESMGDAITHLLGKTRKDSRRHDFSIAAGDAGLTYHCSYDSPLEMRDMLHGHCEARKYLQKTKKWFGIGKYAGSPLPFDMLIGLNFPWEYNEDMEKATKDFFHKPTHKSLVSAIAADKKKPGRNAPCPCGSGKKSKKCCYG